MGWPPAEPTAPALSPWTGMIIRWTTTREGVDWDEEPRTPARMENRFARPQMMRGGAGQVTAGLANGEARPEQQEMCRAVSEALVTGTISWCRPGPGRESPSPTWSAVLSGKKVVVATATKALQDQLARRTCPWSHAQWACPSRSPCSRGAATTSAGNGCSRWETGIQPELGAGPRVTPRPPTSPRRVRS